MKKEVIVPVVIAVIVTGGVGFFGGVQFQKAQEVSFRGGDGK